MGGPSFSRLQPGIFRLQFFVPADVAVELSQPFIPTLIEESAAGPIGIIVVTPADLRLIPTEVVTFWLENFTSRGVKAAAACVVTKSAAVRVVVKGFDMAMKLKGSPISMGSFATEEEALVWTQQHVPSRGG